MPGRSCRVGFAAALAAFLGGCAGNGVGLDANGQPLAPGNTPAPPLSADFQSLQDNVFTPICVRCHSGAAAPQGLELDAAHSYALLVGVPSSEIPQTLRVKPGDPDQSYLVLKLEGAAGIVGAQMPFGGPPLPRATIDFIRQWISDGALRGGADAQPEAQFAVTTISPADHARIAAGPIAIVVGFNHEIDASLINYTTLRLDRLTAHGPEPAGDSLSLALAAGDPRVVLISPAGPLGPGTYRLSLRGRGGGGLADASAGTLAGDYSSEFTVEGPP